MLVSPIIELSDALAAHDIEPETIQKIVAELALKSGCDCPRCKLNEIGDGPVPASSVIAMGDRFGKKLDELEVRVENAESSNTSNTLSILYLGVLCSALAYMVIVHGDEIVSLNRRMMAALQK